MVEVKIINKIGEKVEEYQEKTGTTKTWIAKQMNIKKQTLNTLIKSKNPTIETMIKLAVVLDCDVNELYDTEILQDDMIVKEYRDKFKISLK